MFAKLATLFIAFLAFNATAEDGPLWFDNSRAATAWFAKLYPSHEMRRHPLKVPGIDAEIYAFYGPRGSGIGRLDGWFYSCVKGASCSLIAMTDLGRSRDIKEDPTVIYEAPYLVIKSGDNTLLKIKR
jgi:hypothetical protein